MLNDTSKEAVTSSTEQMKTDQQTTKSLAHDYRDPSKFQINPRTLARNKRIDKIAKAFFTFCAILSGIMIVLIFIFVVSRGVQPFLSSYGEGRQYFGEFLSGMRWRPDQGTYGVLFIIINTLISAAGAALISFPLSVMTALMITRLAPKQVRTFLTMVVELLAAIPSVVFGVFAADQITAFVRNIAGSFGVQSTGLSLLSVIFLLAIMIFPTMTDLAIVAINAVPESLIQGSLAVGASETQTNFKMVLKAARSGIFSGLVLGLGRAFGEATAVSMVAGNGYIFYLDPFEKTRTLTSTMLTGFHETQGVDYDIRFSVGIVLMVLILITNGAIYFIKKNVGGPLHE